MKTTYRCDNHRPFTPEDPLTAPKEAGEHFAAIKARQQYGKRGSVGALRVDSTSWDGSRLEVDAFIGSPSPQDPRSMSGRNIRFIVYRA